MGLGASILMIEAYKMELYVYSHKFSYKYLL